MGVRGGSKLKHHLRQRRRAMERAPKRVSVGIHDPFLSQLAAQLEFGNPDTNLPERPAFRADLDEATLAFRQTLERNIRTRGALTHQGAQEAGDAAAAVIRASYLRFHGEGLSEAQVARKGHDDQLVGADGPRLIEHIRARVESA